MRMREGTENPLKFDRYKSKLSRATSFPSSPIGSPSHRSPLGSPLRRPSVHQKSGMCKFPKLTGSIAGTIEFAN